MSDPQQMLQQAVMLARLAPRLAMGSESSKPDRPPNAHQVAVAIVAASREMKCNPEHVASGVTTRGGRFIDHSIPRARAYAAFAIREIFPQNGATAISRWVGAKNVGGYMSMLDAQRRNGLMKWWDEAGFRRIVAKLRESV